MTEVFGCRLIFRVDNAATKAQYACEGEIINEVCFRIADTGKNSMISGENLIISGKNAVIAVGYIPQLKRKNPSSNPSDDGHTLVVGVRLDFNGFESSTFAWTEIIFHDIKNRESYRQSGNQAYFPANNGIQFMHFDSLSDSHAIAAIRNSMTLEIESRLYFLKADLKNLGKFTLNRKYLELFEEGRHSDVLMRIGETDERINCHSAMICVASPVFDADLIHEVKEKQKREISVADFDFSTMRMLVRFCYVEEIPDSFMNDLSNVLMLLMAANHYRISDLVSKCAEQLILKLPTLIPSADDQMELLTRILWSSDRIGLETLKMASVAYLCFNPDAMKSEAWKRFGCDHASLCIEIGNIVFSKQAIPCV